MAIERHAQSGRCATQFLLIRHCILLLHQKLDDVLRTKWNAFHKRRFSDELFLPKWVSQNQCAEGWTAIPCRNSSFISLQPTVPSHLMKPEQLVWSEHLQFWSSLSGYCHKRSHLQVPGNNFNEVCQLQNLHISQGWCVHKIPSKNTQILDPL